MSLNFRIEGCGLECNLHSMDKLPVSCVCIINFGGFTVLVKDQLSTLGLA